MEKKQTIILVVVALVLAVMVSTLLIFSGSQKQGPGNGLQETKAPWQPEYGHLAEHLQTLGIPPPGTEHYHIHARLAVFAEGKQQPVPANLGLYQTAGVFSALHTHDTTGVIHIESDQPFEVKLSDVFTIWGVKFTDTQVGGYKNDGTNTVQVFVNGKQIEKPTEYAVQPHDDIIVGYGAPGSFPTTFPDAFPPEL